MENDLLDALNDLGYEGPLTDEVAFAKALDGGPKSLEFTKLVHILAEELKSLLNIEETVNVMNDPDESSAFLLELSSFLKELGCSYRKLVTGHMSARLQSKEDKLLLLDYLVSELMAARMVAVDCPKEKPGAGMEIVVQESPTAKDLKDILISLKFNKPPPNITAEMLFTKLEAKLKETLHKEGDQLVGKPLYNKSLSEKEWKQLEAVFTEMYEEYRLRRETLITRLECTIQSFEWSDRLKTKRDVIQSTYRPKRDQLKVKPDVRLSDFLAARTGLLQVEKTSSASVRKNTQSDVNKVIIGQVPDRGGRPNEQQPPPPEMPSWQQRSAPGGGRGGGGGGRGGGGGGGGGGRGGGGPRGGRVQGAYNQGGHGGSQTSSAAFSQNQRSYQTFEVPPGGYNSQGFNNQNQSFGGLQGLQETRDAVENATLMCIPCEPNQEYSRTTKNTGSSDLPFIEQEYILQSPLNKEEFSFVGEFLDEYTPCEPNQEHSRTTNISKSFNLPFTEQEYFRSTKNTGSFDLPFNEQKNSRTTKNTESFDLPFIDQGFPLQPPLIKEDFSCVEEISDEDTAPLVVSLNRPSASLNTPLNLKNKLLEDTQHIKQAFREPLYTETLPLETLTNKKAALLDAPLNTKIVPLGPLNKEPALLEAPLIEEAIALEPLNKKEALLEAPLNTEGIPLPNKEAAILEGPFNTESIPLPNKEAAILEDPLNTGAASVEKLLNKAATLLGEPLNTEAVPLRLLDKEAALEEPVNTKPVSVETLLNKAAALLETPLNQDAALLGEPHNQDSTLLREPLNTETLSVETLLNKAAALLGAPLNEEVHQSRKRRRRKRKGITSELLVNKQAALLEEPINKKAALLEEPLNKKAALLEEPLNKKISLLGEPLNTEAAILGEPLNTEAALTGAPRSTEAAPLKPLLKIDTLPFRVPFNTKVVSLRPLSKLMKTPLHKKATFKSVKSHNAPDDCLRVAIVTEPFFQLTNDEITTVINLLEEAMDNEILNPSSKDRTATFRNKKVSHGKIKLQCDDEYSLHWLVDTIRKITSPRSGTRLVVSKQSDVPKTVMAGLFVPILGSVLCKEAALLGESFNTEAVPSDPLLNKETGLLGVPLDSKATPLGPLNEEATLLRTSLNKEATLYPVSSHNASETCLRVAIVTEPFFQLTNDEITTVINLLEEAMDNEIFNPSSKDRTASFRNKIASHGKIKLQCDDEYSLYWLLDTVSKITSPRSGTRLVVCKQSDVPKTVRAGSFVPTLEPLLNKETAGLGKSLNIEAAPLDPLLNKEAALSAEPLNTQGLSFELLLNKETTLLGQPLYSETALLGVPLNAEAAPLDMPFIKKAALSDLLLNEETGPLGAPLNTEATLLEEPFHTEAAPLDSLLNKAAAVLGESLTTEALTLDPPLNKQIALLEEPLNTQVLSFEPLINKETALLKDPLYTETALIGVPFNAEAAPLDPLLIKEAAPSEPLLNEETELEAPLNTEATLLGEPLQSAHLGPINKEASLLRTSPNEVLTLHPVSLDNASENVLRVAIVTEPFFPLTNNEITIVKNALEEALDDAIFDPSSKDRTASFRCHHSHSIIKLQCDDEYSLHWLLATVSKITSPRSGSKLVVCKQSDVPDIIRAESFVPPLGPVLYKAAALLEAPRNTEAIPLDPLLSKEAFVLGESLNTEAIRLDPLLSKEAFVLGESLNTEAAPLDPPLNKKVALLAKSHKTQDLSLESLLNEETAHLQEPLYTENELIGAPFNTEAAPLDPLLMKKAAPLEPLLNEETAHLGEPIYTETAHIGAPLNAGTALKGAPPPLGPVFYNEVALEEPLNTEAALLEAPLDKETALLEDSFNTKAVALEPLNVEAVLFGESTRAEAPLLGAPFNTEAALLKACLNKKATHLAKPYTEDVSLELLLNKKPELLEEPLNTEAAILGAPFNKVATLDLHLKEAALLEEPLNTKTVASVEPPINKEATLLGKPFNTEAASLDPNLYNVTALVEEATFNTKVVDLGPLNKEAAFLGAPFSKEAALLDEKFDTGAVSFKPLLNKTADLLGEPLNTEDANSELPFNTEVISLELLNKDVALSGTSLNKEAISYPMSSHDSPTKCLRVAIITEPFFPLINDEITTVINALEEVLDDAIFNSSSEDRTASFRKVVSHGIIKLQCQDEYCLRWLIETVSKITSPRSGARLVVCKQSDVPKTVRAELFVPQYKVVDISSIHLFYTYLKLKNPWYDIAEWTEIQIVNRSDGVLFVLEVPLSEVTVILLAGRVVCCGDFSADITFPNEKPI